MKQKTALLLHFLSPFIISFVSFIFLVIFFRPLFINIFVTILFYILFLFISLIFSTAFHEAGHMTFGLLTGYRLISFRVLHTSINYDGKRYHLKFSRMLTFALGQCIMAPPKYNKKHNPFYLYNFGGLIFTYLLTIVSLLLIIFIDVPIVRIIMISLCVINIYFAFTNSIVIKGGINDMCNHIYLKKDPKLVNSVLYELEFNRNVFLGKRYRAKTSYPIYLDGTLNHITFPAYLYRFYYAIDKNDLRLAKRYINKIKNDYNKLSMLPIKTIALFEMMYADIVLENNMKAFRFHFSNIDENMKKIMKMSPDMQYFYQIYQKIYDDKYDIKEEMDKLIDCYENGEKESISFKLELLNNKLEDLSKKA